MNQSIIKKVEAKTIMASSISKDWNRLDVEMELANQPLAMKADHKIDWATLACKQRKLFGCECCQISFRLQFDFIVHIQEFHGQQKLNLKMFKNEEEIIILYFLSTCFESI